MWLMYLYLNIEFQRVSSVQQLIISNTRTLIPFLLIEKHGCLSQYDQWAIILSYQNIQNISFDNR